MGKIFYIMGKSASGKDTIYKEVMKRISTLHPVIMYTTRPIRNNEKDGSTYYFVDDKYLDTLRDDGKIIEERAYTTPYGVWKYATIRNDGQIDLNMFNYLMIGTLQSYVSTANCLGADKIIPIYIESDDDKRLIRSIEREKKQPIKKYDEVCRRFLQDERDFCEANILNAKIKRRFQNDNFEKCVSEIVNMIKSEKGDMEFS